MKTSNRDLLVLTRKESCDKEEMQIEVEMLHQLLFHAEAMSNFCKVNEVIDVNRYKIIDKPSKVERIVRRNSQKPFVFISNKN